MLAASQLPLRCFDIGAGAASVALARCVGLAASGAQRRAHNFDDEKHLAFSPPEPFSRGWAAGGSQSAVFGNSIGDRPVAPRKKLLRALALLRSPHELDGEGLGRAATSAARDGLDDDDWWNAVVKRTKELAPRLALHDVTLILNGMARMRDWTEICFKFCFPVSVLIWSTCPLRISQCSQVQWPKQMCMTKSLLSC